ncbi:MMPL family transporter [Mycobacterium montefiorense]|uniref:MMPL family transporter n=1 Tax=Mycobacterium montefiorense TaxID=154654 RepID=UPI0021F27787|nr:MMPL family transporter [Mycobacterium montefiorense]MCV7427698.1 MMPL family transporter [Mycobacterium montefiorense]GLE50587.1 membrane protein [Mycobacterium montefiorense]
MWESLAAAVTGRRCWRPGLAAVLLGIGLMVVIGGNAAAGQAPLSVPTDSDSAQVDALARQFPGGDRVPLLLVVNRTDGAPLTAADVTAAGAARDRMQAVVAPFGATDAAPPIVSSDAMAAVAVVPIRADLSGLVLTEGVTALRGAADAGLPADLRAHVTGGPAFGADIANAFTDANITLLAVTASVVALLLIVTYRSPVLWLAPLLVVGFADRVAAAVGTAVASLTGLSFDGATSGITSVLVFGAGTNYALLLISRYRQELRSHTEHRDALRRAVRMAGPAIVASNATVVLALLTLLFASTPSTRSLGALAACGLVVAAVSVLVMLPPLLALCGRRLFWPLIPAPDGTATLESGAWHRIAEQVARRPAVVAAVSVAALAALAGGLLGTRIGLSQTQQFRVQADSVSGYDVVAAHFPAGLANPTLVVARSAQASQVRAAIVATPGVVSATDAGQSASGLTKWSVVTDSPPSSDRAFTIIAALRNSTKAADPGVLVGGPDAQALDIRDAAVHDRLMLIPAILAVIAIVLFVLLRSALAPPNLLSATILGALAALGLGGWTSMHVFGFPALDNSTRLFAFLFLAALGVDYTIVLVTRAREEAARHGAREGMIRAVSATGGVITSAGIVLAAVFCVLAVLPLIVLTQLGIIVGLGILLDTFVVRTLVIPALFALIGDRIWWPADPTDTKIVDRQTDSLQDERSRL